MCFIRGFFEVPGVLASFLQQFMMGSGTGAYFFYYRGTNGAQAIVFKVIQYAPVFCFLADQPVFYH